MILKYPNPLLNKECADVVKFDASLKDVVSQMIDEMYTSGGIGLAAPQIGVLQNIIIVDPSAGESNNELTVLINPRINWRSTDLVSLKEGCLSIPGTYVNVLRSVACDVEYYDVDGKVDILKCTGIKARIIQHEIDHLLGVVMLDRISKFEKRLALNNVKKHGYYS